MTGDWLVGRVKVAYDDDDDWWWIDEVSVRPLLQFRNSHECANEDMLRQTVQFLVHVGTRMIVDSCVAVPAASSMWTVQRRRICEDRSGLCMSLERQGRHARFTATNSYYTRDLLKSADYLSRQSSSFSCSEISESGSRLTISSSRPMSICWQQQTQHTIISQIYVCVSVYVYLFNKYFQMYNTFFRQTSACKI